MIQSIFFEVDFLLFVVFEVFLSFPPLTKLSITDSQIWRQGFFFRVEREPVWVRESECVRVRESECVACACACVRQREKEAKPSKNCFHI